MSGIRDSGRNTRVSREKELQLKPSEIRFTQDSIAASFGKGEYTCSQTIQDIRNGATLVSDLPRIKVAVRDNKYYSANNRRLYVFRVLEYEERINNVNVIRIPYDRILNHHGFTSLNDGEKIRVRGDKALQLPHSIQQITRRRKELLSRRRLQTERTVKTNVAPRKPKQSDFADEHRAVTRPISRVYKPTTAYIERSLNTQYQPTTAYNKISLDTQYWNNYEESRFVQTNSHEVSKREKDDGWSSSWMKSIKENWKTVAAVTLVVGLYFFLNKRRQEYDAMATMSEVRNSAFIKFMFSNQPYNI